MENENELNVFIPFDERPIGISNNKKDIFLEESYDISEDLEKMPIELRVLLFYLDYT
jgi:hypothetical protein